MGKKLKNQRPEPDLKARPLLTTELDGLFVVRNDFLVQSKVVDRLHWVEDPLSEQAIGVLARKTNPELLPARITSRGIGVSNPREQDKDVT